MLLVNNVSVRVCALNEHSEVYLQYLKLQVSCLKTLRILKTSRPSIPHPLLCGSQNLLWPGVTQSWKCECIIFWSPQDHIRKKATPLLTEQFNKSTKISLLIAACPSISRRLKQYGSTVITFDHVLFICFTDCLVFYNANVAFN